MRSNLYELLHETWDLQTVAPLVTLTTDDQLSEFAEQIDELDRELLKQTITKFAIKEAIKSCLLTGCLVRLFRCLVASGDGTSLTEFYARVGVSKSQANRCVHVFERAGKRLLEQESLGNMFPVESLKKLCSPGIATAAFDQACAMAEEGKRVTIKIAGELCAKHALSPVTKVSRPKQVFKYQGESLCVIVKSETTDDRVDNSLLITELENLIGQLKEYGVAISTVGKAA